MKPLLLTLFTAFTFVLQHAAEAQTDSTASNNREKAFKNKFPTMILLLNDHGQNPAFAAYNGNLGIATFGEVTTFNNTLLGYSTNTRISLASNNYKSNWKNFGVRYQYSAEGFYRSRAIGFSYAPRFRITPKSTLTSALEMQITKLKFNWPYATFPDMISPDTPGFVRPTELPPHQSVIAPSFTFGMLYEHTNLVIQGVISNLTQRNAGSYRTPGEAASLPRIFSITAAYRIAINRYFACLPSLQLRYNNDLLPKTGKRNFETGTDVLLLNKLSVGAIWNNSHAYTLRTGYFDASGFRFQLAYIYRYKLSETLNVPHRTFQFSINYAVIPARWSTHHSKF